MCQVMLMETSPFAYELKQYFTQESWIQLYLNLK